MNRELIRFDFALQPGKNELLHHCDFINRDMARAAIFDYIEMFYNRQRRHQRFW
ncbi:MAG: hypothetical protein EPO06_06835 [Burkholderiaceae bacterium]|nr:MAG: hypothetical protein EPO06_06835 [Burkholderiaceae bacterium]